MTFVVATGNRGKFEELKRMLSALGIKAVSQKEAGVFVQTEETGSTFEENAELKALAVCKAAGLPTVADDSGLVVDALGGAPGVYSARYAGPKATDKDRIQKLLRELRDIPENKRMARFVCTVCCIFPDGKIVRSRGECEGYIALKESGHGGFGYDPVFIEKSTGKTFAELNNEEKDRVSHRGKALALFSEKLKNLYENKSDG